MYELSLYLDNEICSFVLDLQFIFFIQFIFANEIFFSELNYTELGISFGINSIDFEFFF